MNHPIGHRFEGGLNLPPISDEHLHGRFGRAASPPVPGAGGKDLERAAGYWNKADYERALPTLESSIGAGLSNADESLAQSLLGQIEIHRRNLFSAVEHFLKCAAIYGCDRDMFWEAATRLEMIYRAAGRLSEAFKLAAIAATANPRGFTHERSVENEIRNLVADYMARALEIDDFDIRCQIVDTLCRLGHDAIQPLITVLRDRTLSVEHRKAAAWGLGRLGDKAAFGPLRDIVQDRTEDIGLFMEAKEALESMGYQVS